MKSGLIPNTEKHTDFDYIKSAHPQLYAGIAQYPTFPPEYLVDVGLTMPDQNAEGEPEGCTNYAQADLATDLNGVIHHPADLEAFTHANARGGYTLRESFDAARKNLGWFTSYYNVKAYKPLDPFDAVRLASSSGLPEKRAVSVGTPWFYQFEATQSDGILPTPDTFDTSTASWHDWAICGWKQINGSPYLIGKSWQGENFGDKGFHYVSRALFNSLMAIPGTVAFTGTHESAGSIEKIDLPLLRTWLSYIYTWIGLKY